MCSYEYGRGETLALFLGWICGNPHCAGQVTATRLVWPNDVSGEARGAPQGRAGGGTGGEKFEPMGGGGIVEGGGVKGGGETIDLRARRLSQVAP